MNGVQHKAFGIACGVAYMWYKGADTNTALALLTTALGAALPDYDHPAKKENKAARKTVGAADKIVTYGTYGLGVLAGVSLLAPMLIKGSALSSIVGQANSFTQKYLIWIICVIGIVLLKNMVTKSKTFKWAVAHRGIMHSLIPLGVLWYGRSLFIEGNMFYNILTGIMVGYVSHLYIDMWNKDGCPLLFPFSKKDIGLHLMPTKNISGCWAIIFINAAAILFAAYIYGKGIK